MNDAEGEEEECHQDEDDEVEAEEEEEEDEECVCVCVALQPCLLWTTQLCCKEPPLKVSKKPSAAQTSVLC